MDFNSLAPCGANRLSADGYFEGVEFQLTRPVRGEPLAAVYGTRELIHFNSLAPCGANPVRVARRRRHVKISTHSPRAGRTLGRWGLGLIFRIFQLTRPVRGEPWYIIAIYIDVTNFNSLAPCGANPGLFRLIDQHADFNSLAPCGANRA